MGERGPFQEKTGVRAEGLAVARGVRVLFENLNFAAEPGDYVEVRGANGAGKTSLLRTLAGLMRPAAGRVSIGAGDAPELALHLIGHRDGLKPNFDAPTHLRFWAGLLGGQAGAIPFTLQCLGLGGVGKLPARAMSQGQARRLALGRLLVAHRPVWLLDEPAASLDEGGRVLVAELIAAHCAQGGVVIAALHEPLPLAPRFTVSL